VDKKKQKALLDGMLFEIFFDPEAHLRANPKSRWLSEVFDLQKYTELADSFEFIAECLIPYTDRFHALPGKGHAAAVDIVTRKKGEMYVVEGVFLGGSDILWLEDEEFADDESERPRFITLTTDDFEERLCQEMTIPAHLLTVTYSSAKKPKTKLLVPLGWTTRKQ
jgi:hypothetical protein